MRCRTVQRVLIASIHPLTPAIVPVFSYGQPIRSIRPVWVCADEPRMSAQTHRNPQVSAGISGGRRLTGAATDHAKYLQMRHFRYDSQGGSVGGRNR